MNHECPHRGAFRCFASTCEYPKCLVPVPTREELGDCYDYEEMWQKGWREGYKAALQAITTTQGQLFDA